MSSSTRRDVLKAAAAAVAVRGSGKASADFTPLRSLPVIAKRAMTSKSDYKKRAIADYVANMKPFGGSLARHGRHLLHQPGRGSVPCDFDVVIVGSGYGASICAARLSMAKRQGVKIAVLERGREWIPGTFGDTFRQTNRESRFKLLGPKRNTVDNPLGLVNVMQNDEVNVLSGSGLGGSSLINASVAIRPDHEVFEQMNWPAALRDRSMLDPYYDRASIELGVRREQDDASPKSRAQRLAAQKLAGCGANFENAELTITRGGPCDGPIFNRQGMRQRECIDCGDCCSGCNVGAKNTLAMNYLPMARRHGAEMYTHTEVIRVEKEGTHYRVHFKSYLPDRRGKHKAICGSVTSRIVILGAGSVGSCEILLRSRGCGMELSDRIGHQWTMNGDALGFVRNSCHVTNSAGAGAYARSGGPIGPTIQTNISYPGRSDLSKRVLIQDGSVTKAYATIIGALMRDMDFDHTLSMFGMGHDGSDGRITLREDGLGKISWPGIKESPYRKLIRSEFARLAQAHSGEYKYLRLFGDNFMTVHPLGGCAMADDPLYGVVDDRGRVFDGRFGGMVESNHAPRMLGVKSGAAVHWGLYVADGAVIPTSIACNPLLTISALAERIAEGIIAEPAHRDLFV